MFHEPFTDDDTQPVDAPRCPVCGSHDLRYLYLYASWCCEVCGAGWKDTSADEDEESGR